MIDPTALVCPSETIDIVDLTIQFPWIWLSDPKSIRCGELLASFKRISPFAVGPRSLRLRPGRGPLAPDSRIRLPESAGVAEYRDTRRT
jgi:hypothetical protein